MVDGKEAPTWNQAINMLVINQNLYQIKNSILLEKQKTNSEDEAILKEYSHQWNTIIINNSSIKKDP